MTQFPRRTVNGKFAKPACFPRWRSDWGGSKCVVEWFVDCSFNSIKRKLEKYFHHGTRLAWVVDPKRQTVTVHSLDALAKLTGLASTLTGGEVLPGFRCRLRSLFKLD